MDRIAREAEGALSQANRILEAGVANTRWAHIYQAKRGSGGFVERISRRNALHQEAERLMLRNRYVREAQENLGYLVEFNMGNHLGIISRKGWSLRPDIQIRLGENRWGIIDWTTEGSAMKIFNYAHEDVAYLINIHSFAISTFIWGDCQ